MISLKFLSSQRPINLQPSRKLKLLLKPSQKKLRQRRKLQLLKKSLSKRRSLMKPPKMSSKKKSNLNQTRNLMRRLMSSWPERPLKERRMRPSEAEEVAEGAVDLGERGEQEETGATEAKGETGVTVEIEVTEVIEVIEEGVAEAEVRIGEVETVRTMKVSSLLKRMETSTEEEAEA
jgi:hypothetical protein